MDRDVEAELIAEIEGLRADLKKRADEDERREVDEGMLDVTNLELPQLRALIAKRFSDARYERRLREVEQRLEKLEADRG